MINPIPFKAVYKVEKKGETCERSEVLFFLNCSNISRQFSPETTFGAVGSFCKIADMVK